MRLHRWRLRIAAIPKAYISVAQQEPWQQEAEAPWPPCFGGPLRGAMWRASWGPGWLKQLFPCDYLDPNPSACGGPGLGAMPTAGCFWTHSKVRILEGTHWSASTAMCTVWVGPEWPSYFQASGRDNTVLILCFPDRRPSEAQEDS